MLPLHPSAGGRGLPLPQSAYDVLTAEQRQTLSRPAKLVPLAIPPIKILGGSSARCMLAEVFLPQAIGDLRPSSK